MALNRGGISAGWAWRPLEAADLPEVQVIAKEAFPDHAEDPERFAERLGRGEPFCWALKDQASLLWGYILACPLAEGAPPALNAPLRPVSGQENWLFVHDLGVRAAARGHGLGGQGVRRLIDLARNWSLEGVALVAVNGSARFWSAEGFAVEVPPNPLGRLALVTYGEQAVYMRRRDPLGGPDRAGA